MTTPETPEGTGAAQKVDDGWTGRPLRGSFLAALRTLLLLLLNSQNLSKFLIFPFVVNKN
jgi:hypothetical protein